MGLKDMGSEALPLLLLGPMLGGPIAAGMAEKRAANAEAKQFEENAKLAKLSAEQSAEERQRDLMGTLSSIRAIRTSRGLDPSSPTGMAINDRLSTDASTAMSIDRLNSLGQQSQYHLAASTNRARGRVSLLRGFLESGATAAKFAMAGGGGGK